MITIQLETTDLESLRFSYSPLIEMVSSYKLLNHPASHGMFSAWIDEARHALHGIELPYMQAIILNQHYIADFVTPTPTKPRMSLDEEFAGVRNTPPDLIRKHLGIVIEASAESEIRQHYLMYPHDAVECLLAEMELYWNRVLAHHWARIQSVLENDVLFRAREMALYGVDSMFTNLSPCAQYMTGQLMLDKPYLGREGDMALTTDGRGLQLVPALFKGGAYKISWQVVPEYQPMIIYEARGTGLWYSGSQPDPEAALVLMLGEGKAKLLQALKTPAHTSELAQRLSVTAGAVSQQLGRMNQAGLVESHRNSSKVYYRLTARGEKLLALFAE